LRLAKRTASLIGKLSQAGHAGIFHHFRLMLAQERDSTTVHLGGLVSDPNEVPARLDQTALSVRDAFSDPVRVAHGRHWIKGVMNEKCGAFNRPGIEDVFPNKHLEVVIEPVRPSQRIL